MSERLERRHHTSTAPAPSEHLATHGPHLAHSAFEQPRVATPPAAKTPLAQLDLPGFSLSPLAERRVTQLTYAFLVLGIGLRLLRYLLCCPLWGDEAYVAANFFEQSYADLLQPLRYHQVCPPLFLWTELTIVRLFGFSEYSLRLVPCLAGIATLLLFWRFASGILRGLPLLMAVAFFAVAYYPIRHGGEVKPYATDLFAAMLLMTLLGEWLRRPGEARWLWVLATVTPLLVWLSYPSVFVAGGVGLALGWHAWRHGTASIRLAVVAFGITLLASFGGLQYVMAMAQYQREFGAGGMGDYWQMAFPPVTQPIALVTWLVREHTGHIFAFPIGGKNGASTLNLICFVAGVVLLWRVRRRTLLLACLGPFFLAFVAASLQRYPYGGSTRVVLYLAPAICLIAGLGATWIISWGREPWFRRAMALVAIAVLGLIGAGQGIADLVMPYKTIHDERDRAFADWLWNDKAHGVEMVCVYRDLGLDFFPLNWEWGHSARYLCNQRIYSPRHGGPGQPPDWDAITAERPLVCVVYWVGDLKRDDARFNAWLAEVGQRFELADRERHVLNPDSGYTETYELYTFVPRIKTASAKQINVAR
ncbi:MAG: glycosyltransferase family 39 protein [Pirellulales bacterium]|nr:glycosyltransferase family 39 protein [Pirellulales bacterium]